MYTTIKSFIKWAGGKGQLLDVIRKRYPDKIERYCEPFVGGGAVLFDILANYQPKEVLISDINSELINTYVQIRDNTENVIASLLEMQEIFRKMDKNQRKEYFYSKRERFNELISQSATTEEKASLFIFLNKTCFNGLYRVNQKGLYNVPMGAYEKPLICNADNIRLVSEFLQNVIIKQGDYNNCADFITQDTFVYIDPPYRPISVTSSFTSYTKENFKDEQQIQLGSFIKKIAQKGAKFVASNSDPKNINPNDNFFDDMYQEFSIDRIPATRMINSNSKRRGNITELLIHN